MPSPPAPSAAPVSVAPSLPLAALSAALVAASALALAAPARAAETYTAADHRFRVVEVAKGFDFPWSLAFLPEGGMLIAERSGGLKLLGGEGGPRPIAGVPKVVEAGQGGLHDVVLHPDFARNRVLYLSYAGGESGTMTKVARARLSDGRLEDVRVILEATPPGRTTRHFGARMAFGGDGKLYVTTGDRGADDRAQKLDDLAGKVIRLEDDGSVPADNPFVGRQGVRPEIFSYGHRNPQGAAVHPQTGVLWLHEHGPRGGDEINIPRPGRNYGWPVITHGRAYSGLPMGEGSAKAGMEQPIHYWVPSIAPSGMAFYTGERFPKWKGNLFVGALAGQLLARLELDGERVVKEERLLKDAVGRIRDVRTGPDGYIYLLTDDSNGRLLRLEPAG